MKDNESFDEYADRVRDDHHLHWFALVSVAVWAGAVFGWLWGIGTFIAVYVAILITNTVFLAVRPSFGLVRFSRWAWIVLAIIWIIASTATIEGIKT